MPEVRAVLLVRKEAPATRAALADLAFQRGWKVVAVHELHGDGLQRALRTAHGREYEAVAVPSLSDLGAGPAAALAAVEALAALGVTVASASAEEAWLEEALPTVAHVARWFDGASRRARVAKAKATLAANNSRPGRPRRFVPVAEAQRLVVEEGMSICGAARMLAIPEATLRRALAEKRVADRLDALTQTPSHEAA